MFATIFLTDAKVRTVVPKHFIYRLSQVSLDNNGVNQYQSRRIYFSKNLYDMLERGEVANPTDYKPNFDLAITQQYPMPDELHETCFIGRTLKFWGKFK